jgi:hypothetical protein
MSILITEKNLADGVEGFVRAAKGAAVRSR